MPSAKTATLAAATLFCALGTGYVMQYGLALPGDREHAGGPVEVTGIVDTSATAFDGMPAMDSVPGFGPEARINASEPDLPELPELPATAASLGLPGSAPAPAAPAIAGCTPALAATPLAGAMVRLDLVAPCNPSERVVLHHSGLMVTEVTDADGRLAVEMPALAETALFIASFDSSAGAVAQAQVPSLPFYDRVALQWQDEGGLELHALEFDAEYRGAGHIFQDARGSLSDAVRGLGGFFVRIGNADTAAPRIAEVYSFPAGTAERGGEIEIRIEAEVTASNCGRDLTAQALELRAGVPLGVRDLTLAMPGCEAVGDYLVLKNMIEDLKIAAR